MQQAFTPPSPKRRPPRRALWFMSLLLLLVLLGVTGVARFALRSAADTMRADMARTMASRAQTGVSQLTVWYGSLYEQAARLAASDPVRLFASEADAANPAELLRMSRAEGDDNPAFRPDADDLDEQARLGAQAALMLRQMEDFAARQGLAGAALFNARGVPYLMARPALSGEAGPPSGSAPDFHVSAALDEAVREVLGSGAPRLLPARADAEGRLVMDLALPVFAPLYVDASGGKVVGVLAVAADVTPRVAAMTRPARPGDAAQESARLLQRAADGVQELPADGASPVTLPGWIPSADGGLPLALRPLPGGGAVYSLALSVPDTPLLVELDVPEHVADARYETFRRSVLLSAALVAVVAALLLIMLWWWLLGRRERAVAAELRQLYETVARQNRIIEGVNTTMEDGIALSDAEGRFLYANQAFAALAGETPAQLADKTCSRLGCPDVARSVLAHTQAVHQADAPLTFTEALDIDGRRRRFQVACAPFRDEGGAMIGVVSVYRDITDLLAAQERARHMVNQTVHVFVRAIEAVDPYLRGQSARTGVLAQALAVRLGLADHADTLRTAANLSQIGMIQLPHRLLTKTGALTPEERTQLEKHVDYAREALEGIDFGLPVLEAITHMHERLDGSGYPRHLHGDAIGMDGRILAVAGTFCALLRPRSYRQARSVEQAMGILSATPPQYDPVVVEALRAYLQTPEGGKFYRELIRTD